MLFFSFVIGAKIIFVFTIMIYFYQNDKKGVNDRLNLTIKKLIL